MMHIDKEVLSAVPQVPAVKSFEIGAGDGGPDDEFGRIAGIAVTPNGSLYVLDAFRFSVAVYDSSGRFVRRFGRRGGGPGEFQRVHGENEPRAGSGIAISNDTMFVLDDRLHVFDTTGTHLYTSPNPGPFFNVQALMATPHGLMIQRAVTTQNTNRGVEFVTLEPVTGVESASFRIMETFGVTSDELQRPPVPLPMLVFATSPQGKVLVTAGDSFHVNALAANGEVERAWVSAPPRVPITDSDVDDFVKSFLVYYQTPERRSSADGKRYASSFEKRAKKYPRAQFREAVGGIAGSADGRILLKRSDLAESPYDWTAGVIPRTLLHSDGVPTLNVLLPAGFIPKTLEGCSIHGVQTAEDGAPLVTKYTIPRTEGRC